jgi:hypothetical protein
LKKGRQRRDFFYVGAGAAGWEAAGGTFVP